jgi:hypothetical protein
MVLDQIPNGFALRTLQVDVGSQSGHTAPRATLYGDPTLEDTLDGPVLLVGTSSGSAVLGGPPPPGDRTVDLGEREGWVVHEADRIWVGVVDPVSTDYVQFVVGRGLDEEALIVAATGADFSTTTPVLARSAVPDGLAPLIAASPSDGPFAWPEGEQFMLAGESGTVEVSAVRAEPRLAALWGFWTDDAGGTVIRGQAGSVGALHGSPLGEDARGYVWAEDGMVLSVIGVGSGDEVVDDILRDLRVGTVTEVEAMRRAALDRVPTAEDIGCRAGTPIVTGVDGDVRWGFGVEPPLDASDVWWTCQWTHPVADGTAGYGSWDLPPLGDLGVTTLELVQTVSRRASDLLVGGVAPPGSARVTVQIDGRTVEAVLAEAGPRPGEKLFGAYLPGVPSGATGTPVVATAFDATGVVLGTG